MEKVNVSSERNITLIMDFYELTMSYNYFKLGKGDQIVYFDMFFRKKGNLNRPSVEIPKNRMSVLTGM